ncbi:hypothetical protein DPMN_120516 [Dreissena polymorpha]|uniref:Alpha-macroglobulin-like TED domain-containing protein n=1 Tax=Dreissena polymorpha TaxID=45954 RepID=A0A9D4GP43_DREPO|nr:hypothetical protein DPMN_120516 [Dreissena polymorpha]
MPTGCGEQTMLGFAPDVFVTNYLTATNQLTGDIENKAISFMEKGRHGRSFHPAKKQIFIDDETLTRAIDWMINRQKADGSFPEPGYVIDKDMQAAFILSHWQPAHSQANPIDIEMTAYNLLVTAEAGDMNVGLQIMKWITAQRNSNGGFSSTHVR